MNVFNLKSKSFLILISLIISISGQVVISLPYLASPRKIEIIENIGMDNFASSYSLSGDGSASTPYIFKDIIINLNSLEVGIYIDSSNLYLIIQNVTIKGGAVGIYIINSNFITIKNCELSGNDIGIINDGTDIIIEGNQIVKNSNGILDTGSSNYYISNNISDNGYTGINLTKSFGNTIKNNLISYNGKLDVNNYYGLYITDTSDTYIIGNDFKYNGNGSLHVKIGSSVTNAKIQTNFYSGYYTQYTGGLYYEVPYVIDISISDTKPRVSPHYMESISNENDRIQISSDLEFETAAISRGWVGDGTSLFPYLITGYDFNFNSIFYKHIYIQDVTYHFRILNNRFSNIHGNSMSVALSNLSNVDLSGNYFSNNNIAIYLAQVNETKIQNNQFTSQLGHTMFVDRSNRVNITDNTFSDNFKRTDIGVTGRSSIELISSQFVNINSNNFLDNQGLIGGINQEAYTNNNISISDNIMYNNSYAGIDLFSDNITISNNKIELLFNSAILVQGNHINVNNNQISNVRGGIEIIGDDIYISNNKIDHFGSSKAGIKLDCDNGLIIGNNISIGGTGLNVKRQYAVTPNPISIINNTLSNLDTAIDGQGKFTKIIGNMIADNSVGLRHFGYGLFIADNIFYNNSILALSLPNIVQLEINTLLRNDFLINNELSKNKYISQAYMLVQANFLGNYWSDHILDDLNNDGIADRNYIINAAFNPPIVDNSSVVIPNHSINNILINSKNLFPNQYYAYSEFLNITWQPAVDISGGDITYDLYISNASYVVTVRNERSWEPTPGEILISSNLSSSFYIWDSGMIANKFLNSFDGYLFHLVTNFNAWNTHADLYSNTGFGIGNIESGNYTHTIISNSTSVISENGTISFITSIVYTTLVSTYTFSEEANYPLFFIMPIFLLFLFKRKRKKCNKI